MFAEYAGKHLLLLQGPNGPLFARLLVRLRRVARSVLKVNFHGGDWLFCHGPDTVCYRGPMENWGEYFERLLEQRRIDAVLLFGDCRPIHRVAIERARARGVEVGVFEEGYIRPNFVTFERGGVNGNSSLPRDPAFYAAQVPGSFAPGPRIKNAFLIAALVTILNAIACAFGRPFFPYYRHHRDIRVFVQASYWARGLMRKLWHHLRDARVARKIMHDQMPPYFLVALQVHLDSQISHSPYRCIEDFIEEVVESFAKHAPPKTSLVLKHHPFDRPYRDYQRLVRDLEVRHGLGGRLVYVDLINLPHALRRARGAVVINSTVGLSAVGYGTPTKCMGNAVYDMAGLTHQGSLDSFWTEPEPVDRELSRQYHHFLRRTCQLPGSVWTDVMTDLD